MTKKNALLLIAFNMVISLAIVGLGIVFENWQSLLLKVLNVQYFLSAAILILWYLCTRKLSLAKKILLIACLCLIFVITICSFISYPLFLWAPLILLLCMALGILSLLFSPDDGE